MKNISFLTLAVVGILTVSPSCSSHNKGQVILPKGAVVDIPSQTNNEFWYGESSYLNSNTENFAFPSKIGKVKSMGLGCAPNNDEGKIASAPLVVGDTLYVMNARGILTARSVDKPKKVLRSKSLIAKRKQSSFHGGKIFYSDGKIFVNTGSTKIIAVSADDFSIIWEKEIKSIALSTPVSNDKSVFVVTNDNKTYALDKNNGSINWIHSGVDKNIGILGSANPVVYENYVISSYSSGEMYVLDANSGKIAFMNILNSSKVQTSDFVLSDVDATPKIKDGVLYVVGNGGLLTAISLNNYLTLWEKELASTSDFWIANNSLYIIDDSAMLYCIDIRNGNTVWSKQFPKFENEKKQKNRIVYPSVIMAGDNLVITSSEERIIVASAQNGEILQERKVGGKIGHTPVVVNGKMYLQVLDWWGSDLVIIPKL